MQNKYFKIVAFAAVWAIVAWANIHLFGATHHLLSVGQETVAVGGFACDVAAGVSIGLAIGMLSPCSFICAALSIYALAPLMFC